MLEPEVMRHYGREELGVAIPEGGGFIGTLNVYHECESRRTGFGSEIEIDTFFLLVHCIVSVCQNRLMIQ